MATRYGLKQLLSYTEKFRAPGTTAPLILFTCHWNDEVNFATNDAITAIGRNRGNDWQKSAQFIWQPHQSFADTIIRSTADTHRRHRQPERPTRAYQRSTEYAKAGTRIVFFCQNSSPDLWLPSYRFGASPLVCHCQYQIIWGRPHIISDAKYLSTKVLKYVLKYFLGTYLLVLKYFRKLVLSTYT